MPAKSDPREESAATRYYYRRSLGARDLLPAVGVAVATGIAAFYLTRLFLQRTPLVADRDDAVERTAPTRRRERHSRTRGG